MLCFAFGRGRASAVVAATCAGGERESRGSQGGAGCGGGQASGWGLQRFDLCQTAPLWQGASSIALGDSCPSCTPWLSSCQRDGPQPLCTAPPSGCRLPGSTRRPGRRNARAAHRRREGRARVRQIGPTDWAPKGRCDDAGAGAPAGSSAHPMPAPAPNPSQPGKPRRALLQEATLRRWPKGLPAAALHGQTNIGGREWPSRQPTDGHAAQPPRALLAALLRRGDAPPVVPVGEQGEQGRARGEGRAGAAMQRARRLSLKSPPALQREPARILQRN
jgi:hypothetical protein